MGRHIPFPPRFHEDRPKIIQKRSSLESIAKFFRETGKPVPDSPVPRKCPRGHEDISRETPLLSKWPLGSPSDTRGRVLSFPALFFFPSFVSFSSFLSFPLHLFPPFCFSSLSLSRPKGLVGHGFGHHQWLRSRQSWPW